MRRPSVKIRVGSKEIQQTIFNGNYHGKYCLQKLLGRKITTLVCVTRGMIRAYLIFKHQFNNKSYKNESLKFKYIQSQRYRNTSNLMHFGNIYFDPLHVSLWSCGCIYDTKKPKSRPSYA